MNSTGQTACNCGCGENNFDRNILVAVEALRDKYWLSRAVNYHCVCRCPTHNAAVGGAAHSRHISDLANGIKCDAADFDIEGIDPHIVRVTIDAEWDHGMELNTDTWVHLDLRSPRARFGAK